MIKSQDIIRLLKDKSTDLSREEIEKIIEEELTKSESEMDADLIELCFDALSEKVSEEKVKPKKKFSLKVASFIAAAAVLVFVITTVIPRLTDNNNPVIGTTETTTEHVTKDTDSVTIPSTTKANESDNLPTEAKTAPIVKEEVTPSQKTKGDITLPPEGSLEQQARKFLTKNDFENLLLPKVIFESGTILKTFSDEKTAEIEISSDVRIYNITIEKSTEDIEEKNPIDVNGLSVSVESENNSSEITYRKDNLNYRIVFHSDYKEAVRIAKAIC